MAGKKNCSVHMKPANKHKFFTKREKEIVLAKTGGICAHCGCGLDIGSMTVDHVFPVDKGGLDDEYNLLPLCDACNQQKSNYVYPLDDWYTYILADEFEKFDMYFNYATFEYTRKTIIGYDIMYFYIIPEKFKQILSNMRARHTPKKKIDDFVARVMMPVPMTKAYPGEAEEIFKFMSKIEGKGYLGVNVYRNYYDVMQDIMDGEVYVLGTRNGICGVFLFRNIEKSGIGILPHQVHMEAEKMGVSLKYVMMYASVDAHMFDGFNMVMNYLESSQLYNGWMPLYAGILDGMCLTRDKCVIMPFSINGMDTMLEFVPVEHMANLRRKRVAGLMAEQGYTDVPDEDVDFFGMASIRYNYRADYAGNRDMDDFLRKYPDCAKFFKQDDYELYGRGFVSSL